MKVGVAADNVSIIVAGAADRVEILRARRGVKNSPTVVVGNHFIAVAMQDQERGAGAPVRVLAIFSDGSERWGTVGVAADILQASVECIIDGLEWKLRGEHKH